MRAVEQTSPVDEVGEFRVPLGAGEVNGATGGCDGLVEASRLGVGGGEDVEQSRCFAGRFATEVFGQTCCTMMPPPPLERVASLGTFDSPDSFGTSSLVLMAK